MMFRSIFLAIFILQVLNASGQGTMRTIDSLNQELRMITASNEQKVDILNELGYRYWIVASNESLIYGKEALILAQDLEYLKGIARAKRVLGVAYWTLGDAKLALENLTASQESYKAIGNKKGEANALMNTGMVYADIREYEKALDIYDRSIQKFSELGLKQRIATTFTKIGYVLLLQEKLDEALDYLTNALNMHTEDNYVYGMAEAHNYLAQLYLDQGELEQADYHLRKAEVLGRLVKDEDGYIRNLILYGKLQRFREEYRDSENHLLEALEKAQSKQLRKYMLAAYGELRLLKKAQGEFNASLNYYDAFIALKDSIYNNDKSKQIAALEFGKELTDKEREIAILREKERTNTIIKWSLGTGGLCLGIISFLLVKNQRQRTIKKQELLASQEELAKTALENAHLKEKELKQEITFKNKELTSYTLNFVQKNELLHSLREKIEVTKNADPSEQRKLLNELSRDIKQHVNIDKDWEDFKRFFEEVHTDFHRKLKEEHPDLSANDLKICSLTRLNLNVKETASVLGISPESAKTARYRLRKKLDIRPEDELLDYFLELEKS
ncbi:MAG: tetratricopeptide repeat protein [Saonia sp.]